jgi:hypothetical protein
LKILLRPNTKKGITRAAHLNPCFIGGVGRLKNTLRPNTKKGITRAAHHSIPAL